MPEYRYRVWSPTPKGIVNHKQGHLYKRMSDAIYRKMECEALEIRFGHPPVLDFEIQTIELIVVKHALDS